MASLSNIPGWAYKLGLVFTTVIWGLSYTVAKNALEVVPAAWLVGMRFLGAGVLLGAILLPRIRRIFTFRLMGAGMTLGLFDFLGAYLQTIGLEHTTPGVSAFLTATYCIIVPFIWWLIARRRPTAANLGAAVLAIGGIWLVSVSASEGALSIGFGEGITILCAFMFALHLAFTSKFAERHDVLALTVFQFLTEGALGCLIGAATETPPSITALTPTIAGELFFLTVVCSLLCFALQNTALAHVSPSQASLLLSLESVFGVLFSVLIYGEQVTARLGAGFVLIFAAVLVSEALPHRRRPPA